MGTSARLMRPPEVERPRPANSEPEALGKKSRKECKYRGICITCGEKIEIETDRMEAALFAFCNAECKERFDREVNEDLD